jgi:1-acyl-sn-glycerol-3-phosphate acyltransferase
LFAILYAFVFYPVLAVYSWLAVAVLGLWMLACLPFSTRERQFRRFRRCIGFYGWGVVRILARPVCRVVYEAAPRNPGEAKIFVANHVSSSDPFLAGLLSEPVVQVVNTWPFKLPLWGRFARYAGYLNIRATTPEAFQSEAARLLAEGTSVVAFPEGTRAGDGPVAPFHGAVFRLALASGVPVVPMCIVGNERAPARGSLVLEPSTVRVRCLPEIRAPEYRSLSPFQFKNRVRQRIIDEVARLRRKEKE